MGFAVNSLPGAGQKNRTRPLECDTGNDFSTKGRCLGKTNHPDRLFFVIPTIVSIDKKNRS